MATMQELRQEAKAAGVPVSEIRSAESAEELQGMIAGYTTLPNRPKKKKGSVMVRKAKKSVAVKKATAVKRGPGRPKGSTNKPKAAITKRGPGRPKGSTTKPKATTARRGRPPGVKNKTATKTVAKRTTRKTTISNGRHLRNVASTDGRHILDDAIDYHDTEGWNPRTDSAPDVILNALRRHKGNREKVFEMLKGRVWEFVGKKLRNGSKRSLSDAHAMLKYRIARTDWDFAIKTGQHDVATDRAKYGSAGTGQGTWKPAKKKATATAPKRRGRPPGRKATTATRTVTKRRGRPPGSKNKTTATKAIAKRGPGRPKGSKNKR